MLAKPGEHWSRIRNREARIHRYCYLHSLLPADLLWVLTAGSIHTLATTVLLTRSVPPALMVFNKTQPPSVNAAAPLIASCHEYIFSAIINHIFKTHYRHLQEIWLYIISAGIILCDKRISAARKIIEVPAAIPESVLGGCANGCSRH